MGALKGVITEKVAKYIFKVAWTLKKLNDSNSEKTVKSFRIGDKIWNLTVCYCH